MSVYAVNKVCRRVVSEPEFRQQLQSDPEAALRAARPPLSEEEIALLLAGEVGKLARHGAHPFLLSHLGRFELLGMTLPEHGRRMRAEYAAERAEWKSSGELSASGPAT
jgi:Aromatic-ring-opening dioxygenase LigAB, LigA subunit